MELLCKKFCNSEEYDRLSDLPADIIHHILSLLDTKYAVRTSALSKKWRNIWVDVPVLNLNSNSFIYLNSFKKFVLAVLHKRSHNSDTSTFCFSLVRRSVDGRFKKKIIDHAISHNVNNLFLDMGSVKYPIPQALLACQTFKTMQLKGFAFFQPFSSTVITALHLKDCLFSDTDCCDLLECFPSLNNLCLLDCKFTKVNILKIYGLHLLNLTIGWSLYYHSSLSKVEISAPKLTFFCCTRPEALDFSVMNLSSLEHADINVCRSCVCHPYGCRLKKTADKLNLIKLFVSLYNAQSVTLSYHAIQALDEVSGIEHLPTPFSRLKSLKVTPSPYNDCSYTIPAKVSTYLLTGSPCPEIDLVKSQRIG